MAAHGLNVVAESGVCPLVRHPMYAASREPITVDTVALTLPEGWTTAQRDSALTVLARYRAQWVAARPERYRYHEHARCSCGMSWPGPRVVTVVGARVVSATDTTRTLSDSAYVRASAHGAGGGIDALFDRIAAGIRDTAHAAVHVAFDPARGYPTRITFDRRWFVSDDELHIDVREVEALP